MCEVQIAPSSLAMLLTRRAEPRAELFDRHAGLLCADVLHAEPEDAGELREVVDVAARMNEREHVAPPNCFALLAGEAVRAAITVLVAQECNAVFRSIERVTHLVERVSFLGFRAVEDHGARDLVRHAENCRTPAAVDLYVHPRAAYR